MATSVTMSKAMKGVNKAMGAANKRMNPQKMQETMKKFEMNMQQMDMTEEMMNDTLMDAFDDEGAEGEVDAITQQALDEIGVDLTAMMAAAPSTKVGAAVADTTAEEEDLLPGLQLCPHVSNQMRIIFL